MKHIAFLIILSIFLSGCFPIVEKPLTAVDFTNTGVESPVFEANQILIYQLYGEWYATVIRPQNPFRGDKDEKRLEEFCGYDQLDWSYGEGLGTAQLPSGCRMLTVDEFEKVDPSNLPHFVLDSIEIFRWRGQYMYNWYARVNNDFDKMRVAQFCGYAANRLNWKGGPNSYAAPLYNGCRPIEDALYGTDYSLPLPCNPVAGIESDWTMGWSCQSADFNLDPKTYINEGTYMSLHFYVWDKIDGFAIALGDDEPSRLQAMAWVDGVIGCRLDWYDAGEDGQYGFSAYVPESCIIPAN